MNAREPRNIPELAVSAAIFRDGKVLLARRARDPARGLFTLPGGRVEFGETLVEAVMREVREETRLTIALGNVAGYRDVIGRNARGNVERHYLIVAFAAQWLAGEPVLDAEHDEFRWVAPEDVTGYATTEGLGDIVISAARLIDA